MTLVVIIIVVYLWHLKRRFAYIPISSNDDSIQMTNFQIPVYPPTPSASPVMTPPDLSTPLSDIPSIPPATPDDNLSTSTSPSPIARRTRSQTRKKLFFVHNCDSL